ncbi:hypothetical protein C8R44DRAFT_756284 [Mycena epipterygia]|nr:hypothetical protein C8R44DRAFT_756284 [Mycena epipterygia]
MNRSARTDDDEKVPSYEEARASAAPGAQTFTVHLSVAVSRFALRRDRDHYVVLQGRPVKVVDTSTNKAGYSTKMHIIGFDIFTGKKLEDMIRLPATIVVPVVTKHEYMLINIDAPLLHLLSDAGQTKDDVDLPPGPLGPLLAADFALGKDLRVMTRAALDEEMVFSYREATEEE